ncbi:MAG TPA: ATP-binding protein [Rectinemataceae bacterium]|nr:ATP-binding protein [Rectinemataceae bacterium]
MIISILQNISLIVSLAVAYHYVARQLHGKPLTVSTINGLLFGGAAILAMLSPFKVAEGIIYDGRTIVLAVAGLFGGPLVASIAAAMAIAFRVFSIGGTGYFAGVLSIIEAASIGLYVFYRRKRTGKPLTVFGIILIGYAVHIFMLLAQLFLPNQRWKAIIPAIAVPVLVLFPFAFLLICALFIDNEERLKNQRMLEESEARYKLLFQNNHTVMMLIDDTTGRIIDANPAAEAFYGWTRAELLSMHVSDINTLTFDELKAELRLAKESNKTMFTFRHRRAFGDIRDVEVFSGPIEYFGKKVLYSIVHDATARIKAENEVRELNQTLEQRVEKRTRELEEANKELEAFAYSVSHDLRAPLRAIEGFSSLLDQETGKSISEEAAHYLERINSNAKKMSQLIDDLLRLSRISRKTVDFLTVDLSQLAKGIISEMRSQTPERQVEAFIQEGMSAFADKALLELALFNLLSNAWKFTSSVPKPSIRFACMDSGNERVYSVSDNGIGFDMAYAEKLFSPFQRLHSEKEYSGSGIGLSIVRRIVSRHGGRVWVDSVPNQGTTFYFTLGGNDAIGLS